MKKYWFWFFMLMAFGSVIMVIWLQRQTIPVNQSPTTTIPTSLPTVTPKAAWPTLSALENTPIISMPETIKANLIAQLPYQTNGFLVEYLTKANKFYVTIKAPNHQSNYEQAVSWLTDQQVPNPQNNQQIRFVYLEHE